jgi:adenosylmethionine-8-amino-7-oxononanoate aminotransferase
MSQLLEAPAAALEGAPADPSAARIPALAIAPAPAAVPAPAPAARVPALAIAPAPAAAPAPRTGPYKTADLERVWHAWVQMSAFLKNRPTVIVEGEGAYVTDDRGNKYIDAISAIWNVNVGHRHPRVVARITEQLGRLEHFSLMGFSNGPSLDLAAKLEEVTDGRYPHVFYTNSGSEANDTAIKIARQYHRNRGDTGRYKVISLETSYHGCTFGALSATGIEEDKAAFGPMLPGFSHIIKPDCFRCPLGLRKESCGMACAGALERRILEEGPESVAAFIYEPVMGSMGALVPPKDYFPRIREICDRYGVLMIADEVATGFGRTGTWFAMEHWGVWPDLMSVAKGLTGGYVPMGAVLVTDEIYQAFLGTAESGKHLAHGFSTSGHPLACSAALAVIEVLQDEGLVERSRVLGDYLLGRLHELEAFPFIGNVQGLGLFCGFELLADRETGAPMEPKRAGATAAELFCWMTARKGVITFPASEHSVVVLPPFIFTEELVDRTVQVLTETAAWFAKL